MEMVGATKKLGGCMKDAIRTPADGRRIHQEKAKQRNEDYD